MSNITVILSFTTFLLIITGIGVVASIVAHKKTAEDYLIANREIPAWLAALSAVATNNSGFMFIGLIGYTYRLGIEAIWMMLGWIVGDLLAWIYVHKRVRATSGNMQVNTIPRLIATDDNGANHTLVKIGGILTFMFLGAYAAAQLTAASTALESLFGWEPYVGAVIGTVIVVIYCYSGGIRASIWTDAAQSIVMISSMFLLVLMGMWQIGGPGELWANLEAQDPQLVNWLPENLRFGFLLYLLGMTAGGFGAVGQPHILVRFMAIESVEKIREARFIYFLWFIPFFCFSIAVGLYSRALLPDLMSHPITQGFDPDKAAEYAMPLLALKLLPDILIGLILAGLFSATMSTADSQILVCSGSITQDVFPQWKNSYIASKVSTLLVAGLAFLITIMSVESVFSLVLIAWSALGASLGPVLIYRLYKGVPPTGLAITMMLTGLLAVFAWNSAEYDGDIFKLLPGFAAPLLVYCLYTWFFDTSGKNSDKAESLHSTSPDM